MKENKNIPVEAGVTYKMVMTPKQEKHLKSLIVDLMVDIVKTISEIEREQARKEISEKRRSDSCQKIGICPR